MREFGFVSNCVFGVCSFEMLLDESGVEKSQSSCV